MEIKRTKNKFMLFGRKETAFTKALAYILMNEKRAFEVFVNLLQIDITINHADISIEIEKKDDDGRTDIEIKYINETHIIIEAKIGANYIKEQHKKYIERFKSHNNVMCFLTSYPDTYIHIDSDKFKFRCITWYDIIAAFKELNDKYKSTDIEDFLEYLDSDFVKVHKKEVLIQDMGNENEIRRLDEFKVYRTGVTRGVPSHFAPYFTGGKGVKMIYKIEHVLTINPKGLNLDYVLNKYSKWEEGLKLVNLENEDIFFTYYLLSEPKQVEPPILKKHCDFIPNQIPRNFCISMGKIK